VREQTQAGGERGIPPFKNRRVEPAHDGDHNDGGDDHKEDESNKGLEVLTDPVEDLGEAEFVPIHGAVDEGVSVQAFDLDVKAVRSQEHIGGGEGDARITVEEAVVVPSDSIKAAASCSREL